MQKIRTFIFQPLITGSTITFFGSFIASLFNFFFNLFMSRNLSTENFGSLSALISLTILFGLVGGAITPTVINFSASYFAKNELRMIRWLFLTISKYSVVLGFINLVIFFVFKDSIGGFFHIDHDLIVLAGLVIFLGFVGVVNIPLLQGKLAFSFVTFLNMTASFLKFLLGAIFVLANFSIYGAIWAIFLSQLVQYILSFIPLRFIFEKFGTMPKIRPRELFTYGLPSAVALFSLNSLVNTDILLVKHFFSSSDAGVYAGLALLGKVIFYFSAPIATVMFPLVVQKHEKKEKYTSIFRLSLFLVFLLSAGVVIFYFLFPEFVIRLFLKNEQYFVLSSLLGIFGILIAVYALLSVIVYFYLSIKKTKVFIPLIIASVLQAVLIWIYHESYLQIIMISLGIMSGVFILLYLFLLRYR